MRRAEDKPETAPDRPDLFTIAPVPQAPLDAAQRLACLRLIRSESVGPVSFRELINHFGGAAEALEALPDLARRGGRRRPLSVCSRALAEAELESAERVGATPIFTIEPGYPRALVAVDVPPPMLYVRGRRELLTRPTVAMVGSRQSSAAGMTLAGTMAREIAAAGYMLVSGLARGIDTAVHEATLATGTAAVIAGGIDHIYPPENAALYHAIAERGCLISEQPPGYKPRGTDFPRRNRIIAGMAAGVVVVEAANRSGSLITARLAAEWGREVMAVPGHPLDPRAEGTNRLLKDGATFVTSAADVIEALAAQTGFIPPPMSHHAGHLGAAEPSPVRRQLNPVRNLSDSTETGREAVLTALGPAPIAIDLLARAVGLAIGEVRAVLLELVLAGRVEMHGQQMVSLKPEPPR